MTPLQSFITKAREMRENVPAAKHINSSSGRDEYARFAVNSLPVLLNIIEMQRGSLEYIEKYEILEKDKRGDLPETVAEFTNKATDRLLESIINPDQTKVGNRNE